MRARGEDLAAYRGGGGGGGCAKREGMFDLVGEEWI